MSKSRIILGLRAAATLFAIFFLMSSCRSTNQLREDKTMMESGITSEKLDNGCRCAEEGKKCNCKKGGCLSSLGGESAEDSNVDSCACNNLH